MPQQLHVIRCYNCETFQVDIVKKIPKWSCKMCGEKQSLKKIYCMGTGKECREFVQNLNKQRHTLQTSLCNESLADISHAEYKELDNSSYRHENKWSEYILKNKDLSEERLNNSFQINKTNMNENTGNNYKETKHCTDRLYSKSKNIADIEINSKLGLYNISQCTNVCEEALITRPTIKTEIIKRKSDDNIESTKWKFFLSNEQYDNSSYLKPKEASDKLHKENTTELNKISSIYSNKFGEVCDIDTDLEI